MLNTHSKPTWSGPDVRPPETQAPKNGPPALPSFLLQSVPVHRNPSAELVGELGELVGYRARQFSDRYAICGNGVKFRGAVFRRLPSLWACRQKGQPTRIDHPFACPEIDVTAVTLDSFPIIASPSLVPCSMLPFLFPLPLFERDKQHTFTNSRDPLLEILTIGFVFYSAFFCLFLAIPLSTR